MKMDMEKGAIISDCGRYRFQLTRCWEAHKAVCCFIMLNPSTADDKIDDPTIVRCIEKAKRWGYGTILVVNLFAWRATDPGALAIADDPVGHGNDKAIWSTCQLADLVVVAWGTGGKLMDRGQRITTRLDNGGTKMKCLGVTKCGHPKHPLYIPHEKQLIDWPTDRRDA